MSQIGLPAVEPAEDDARGRGRVYSWVTAWRALDPAFSSQTPYTIVVVDLDEDCRVMGRFIEPQAPSAGDRVEFTPYKQGDTKLVGFATREARV
jgi:uncharacterized OB-fold protein